MKKYFITVMAALMASMMLNAQDEVQPYFSVDQLPDLIKCLPAPPAFDSPEFANDMMRFSWGKQQRLNPERAEIAKRDAVWSYEALLAEFDVPFGLHMSPENTPEIWKLMVTSMTTTDAMRVAPKAYYHRQRPFERFQDKMLTDEEAELTGEGSYPSGHTMRGWTAALLLAEVNPAAADTIFARGWMYGESRVIVGAHWQSDVDASRVAASIAVCALHGSPEFREQMAKAQEEYREKTGQSLNVAEVAPSTPATSSQAYRLDGIQATKDTRGIIIKDGKKILKN
jgi:acid phosphatase (class A)